jgi:serine/alanine adding enzyme
MNITIKHEAPDNSTWNGFLQSHPHKNIYQSPFMHTVYQNTKKYSPKVLGLYQDTELIGILLAYLQEFKSGPAGYFSRRLVIVGGPLVEDNNPDYVDLLLSEYQRSISKLAIYTEVRNFFTQDVLISVFAKHGYVFQEHLNILVDLNKLEEDLWKEVHSKRRNEIRRARKEGTTVVEETNLQTLNTGYDILKEVYERAKLPIPDLTFFTSAFKNSNEETGLRIFTARNADQIIGVMFTLVFGKTIFDWYAGSRREFYKKYPNDLIPWEVFLWGLSKGYTSFDFGGAGKPGVPYGVRDYKKKFGGEFVNYGRYNCIHKPLTMKIAKTGFTLLQRMGKIK